MCFFGRTHGHPRNCNPPVFYLPDLPYGFVARLDISDAGLLAEHETLSSSPQSGVGVTHIVPI